MVFNLIFGSGGSKIILTLLEKVITFHIKFILIYV